jgi:hypothetical protein
LGVRRAGVCSTFPLERGLSMTMVTASGKTALLTGSGGCISGGGVL